MPYALRTFTCIECSMPFDRRRPAAWAGRCIPCAVKYSAVEQRQLHNHRGPEYDRWRWNWAKGIRRALREQPPVEVKRVA